jgi:hypothetical protein
VVLKIAPPAGDAPFFAFLRRHVSKKTQGFNAKKSLKLRQANQMREYGTD